MNTQPPLFEKIKQQYGMYPKPMMVNLEVANTMDRKSQTRRLIKNRSELDFITLCAKSNIKEEEIKSFIKSYSKWQVGDILWIREPAKVVKHWDEYGTLVEYLSDGEQITIYPDDRVADKKWFTNCQGIPNGCTKEMARYFRIVTDVRVERLRTIGYKDIKAEGYPEEEIIQHFCDTGTGNITPIEWWIALWNSTAPKGYKFIDNPLVFVYEFEKLEIK